MRFFTICSFSVATLWSAQAFAAAGDDSASDIASRTAPGETTSQSCGPNGFVIVTFLSGGTVVSTIESGTSCIPGGGGGGGGDGSSPPLPSDVQSQLEQDLLQQRINGLTAGLLSDTSDASVDGLLDEQLEVAEDSEFSDEEKSALLSSYRAQLSSARSELSDYRRDLSDLRGQLSTAKSEAASKLPQLQANLRNAEARLDSARASVADLPTAVAVVRAGAKLDELQRTAEEWRKRSQSVTYSRPEYARNMFGASQARVALAEQELDAAKAAHRTASIAHMADAENAVSDAERALSDNDSIVQGLERRISNGEKVASLAQDEITRLQGLIRALEQQNQFAGPSGDTFEVLRARGVEFWSRGSVGTANDTQAGRNQEIDQQEITVGVQGRFSERLLAGLAVSFTDADNDDKTGAAISSDTETFLFAPYLAYKLREDMALDAGLIYGTTDVSLTRAGTATASYDAKTFGGQLGLSLRHRLSEIARLTGRIGQSYVTTDSDAYTDTGGVGVAASDNEQAVTSLSGRITASTDPDWLWNGALKIRYDTIEPDNNVDRFYGNLSAGFEYNPGTYSIAVQADRSVFRSDYRATNLSLQVRVPF